MRIGMQHTLAADHPSSGSNGLESESQPSSSGRGGCDSHTKTSPNLPVPIIDLQNSLKVFNSLVELFARPKDQTDGIHCRDGLWVRSKRILICAHGIVEAAEKLGEAACKGV